MQDVCCAFELAIGHVELTFSKLFLFQCRAGLVFVLLLLFLHCYPNACILCEAC